MSAPEPRHRLTVDEYRALPDDPLYRDELVRGWLVREPRPGEEHGWVTAKLAHYLTQAVDEEHPGRVLTDSGFLLEQDPPTVRGPDVSFISARRAPAPVRGFPHMAPDLAVEVLSPGNRAREMREKVRDYFAAGCRVVWIVDPRGRTVTVYTSLHEATVLHATDELTGGDVLPRFRLSVATLF
jgi:Uma2 family endonuclease